MSFTSVPFLSPKPLSSSAFLSHFQFLICSGNCFVQKERCICSRLFSLFFLLIGFLLLFTFLSCSITGSVPEIIPLKLFFLFKTWYSSLVIYEYNCKDVLKNIFHRIYYIHLLVPCALALCVNVTIFVGSDSR